MDERAALAEIDATLKARGFREVGPGFADYDGNVAVHGKPIAVHVSVPDVRFVTRPKVRLKDRSQLPLERLAHIESDSGICYASGAGLPVDLYQPGQAILRVLEEVARTLELSYRGRAQAEMVDEYQHYWKGELEIRLFVPRSADPDREEYSWTVAAKDGVPAFVAITQDGNLRGYKMDGSLPALVWRLSKPLGPTAHLVIPRTVAELETWFCAQEALAGRGWARTFQMLVEGKLIVLAAPNAVLAIKVSIPRDLASAARTRAVRPEALPGILASRSTTLPISRYEGRWSSWEDVSARNLGSLKTLAGTSIALVGCGTIGSHLAKFLVQCGAGIHARLSLYDSQVLADGNIGRHLLGFNAVGKPKASALKNELEHFHPDVTVAAHITDAISEWDALASHELIIDATGDWNVQSALNDAFLVSGGRTTALLHTWVFMNGAGVQSFLNLRDEYACFRCLKPSFAEPWRYPVADQGEALNLQPASCGDGAYVAFSVDASVMAASLTNRAVLDWRQGKPGSRLRSAIVDLDRGRHQKPINPTPSQNCPACSSLRKTT